MKSVLPVIYLLLQYISLQAQELRAPAYPLITHTPYFSVWSFGDQLNGTPTKHWTGREQPLTGIIKVDGNAYNFIGEAPVVYEDILPTAEQAPYVARYTYEKPATGWEKETFSDEPWKSGEAPFGNSGRTNAARTRTLFDKEIWYRREFTLKNTNFDDLLLNISYDDDVEVYINGVKAYACSPCNEIQYVKLPLPAEAAKALKPGRNVLAVHCTNVGRWAYIDAGLTDVHRPVKITPAVQKSVELSATQTAYRFTAGKEDIRVTFTSPLLMNRLEVLARPATYVTFDVQSNDGKPHDVQVIFGFSGVLSTNDPYQGVVVKKDNQSGLMLQSAGTASQPVLARKGDNVRIDWGYAYLAVPQKKSVVPTPGTVPGLLQYLKGATVKTAASADSVPAKNSFTGVAISMGKVQGKQTEHAIMAYDEEYAVQYFEKNLRPWWRRSDTMTAVKMLSGAEKDYAALMQQCTAFDKEMYANAQAAGGKEYADLCRLSYRQAIAAHTVVDRGDGTLLFFSKENFSNGSIGTVDITYPSAPLFILYNVELMKGMMRFIFEYSESGRWKKPFAAHDVGTYPLANGQTYREDMPVEETGNMIILTAAIAEKEKNASFAKEHWDVLTTWAGYLKEAGFDPANQLCTDDFAGHLARNANLSVKAIVGLACYGKLAGMLGKTDVQKEYTDLAKSMSGKWMQLARDGDHYGLQFDTAGTWSQKYNLVWDKLLRLNIFPQSVYDNEIAYYKTKQQQYALPLDSRKTYTKSDWIVWTATLTRNDTDFKTFVAPVWKYANETADRIPLSDWHETTNAKSVGFRARSVVGGYFIKLLEKELLK